MRRLISIIALFAAALPAASQTVSVGGVVKDVFFDDPLVGERIILRGESQDLAAETDDAGAFTFSGLTPGLYAVIVGDHNPPTFVTVGPNGAFELVIEAFPESDSEMMAFMESIHDYSPESVGGLVSFVLASNGEMPQIGDFPNRGSFPFVVAGSDRDVLNALQSELPRRLGTPIDVRKEGPSSYVITWYHVERDATNEHRFRRNSYLLRVSESDRDACSTVKLQWLTQSCGVRERTWRTTEGDLHYVPDPVPRLASWLSGELRCP